jgi:hypothetical protein
VFISFKVPRCKLCVAPQASGARHHVSRGKVATILFRKVKHDASRGKVATILFRKVKHHVSRVKVATILFRKVKHRGRTCHRPNSPEATRCRYVTWAQPIGRDRV